MIPYLIVRGLFYLPFILAALWISSMDLPIRVEVSIGLSLGLIFLIILPFSAYYPAKWCLGYRQEEKPQQGGPGYPPQSVGSPDP